MGMKTPEFDEVPATHSNEGWTETSYRAAHFQALTL